MFFFFVVTISLFQHTNSTRCSPTLKKDGAIKFLPKMVKGKAKQQRWVCDNKEAYKDDLVGTSKLLKEYMGRAEFPDCISSLNMNWSILRSDANISEPQEAQTHLVPEYSYGNDCKVFHFSCIVGIEQHTFVDLQISNHFHFVVHILLLRGDVLFIRNDIPHRRCENMSDFDHHRLHCHIEPQSLVKKRYRCIEGNFPIWPSSNL